MKSPPLAGFLLFNSGSAFGQVAYRLPTSDTNKKARYIFSSGLFNAYKVYLVGPAGVEPTTNGLKVRCSTN